MTLFKSVAIATLVTLWPIGASAQTSHEAHHPAGAPAAPAASTPAAPQALGMTGMMGGQHGMMAGHHPMMGMMTGGHHGMMAGPRPGMATIDHVEGRIAFLRTELAITDAQAGAWNGFADALRANAKLLRDVRGAMMQPAGTGEPATLGHRLDLQERWLAARLDGTRTMKAAFLKLHEALSVEQKKTADMLMAPHMGMGPMAMMGPMNMMGMGRPRP
jgi:LTXXQ motif family protein